jgi:hypothetical protein
MDMGKSPCCFGMNCEASYFGRAEHYAVWLVLQRSTSSALELAFQYCDDLLVPVLRSPHDSGFSLIVWDIDPIRRL